MGIIQTAKLIYEYIKYDDDGNPSGKYRALDDVNMDIEKGSFVAILGHNGSGKSTLAKHFNALFLPESGTVWIEGRDTADEDLLWDIRQTTGMVFQNPDNQIIGNIVEEDVAFGPENMGVETAQIWERVDAALKSTGMQAYRLKSPHMLSGGQKQRVAIAGILAMKPKCIVLDEPTAMLDPNGRKEVISTLHELNRQEGITIVLITHYMEEVTDADRLIVMKGGSVLMDGAPDAVFSRVDELSDCGLKVPQVTELAYALRQKGLPMPESVLTADDFVSRYTELVTKGLAPRHALGPAADRGSLTEGNANRSAEMRDEADLRLELRDVSYIYQAGTVHESHALHNVNIKIYKGEFIGLAGHTGSGKSTLIQHFNGLIRPTSGTVLYRGQDIYEKDFSLRNLRQKVGLVFQYPEHQLFEETVLQDVEFGPKNLGMRPNEARECAIAALRLVNLDEKYYHASPFDLSGGQKRRAAIAGVLAMNPEVLILDEPTAGLDPVGRDEILEAVSRLRRERQITIVLVSHSMEDIAEYADRLIVMSKGEKVFDDTTTAVFSELERLERIQLAAPQVSYVMAGLRRRGFDIPEGIITVEQALQVLA